MGKRYHWLKLQEGFFGSKRIKKLRKLAGGDTFVIIYLKMQLLSVKTGGLLKYSGLEKSFAEELALELDEEVENVAVVLQYLNSTNLIETSDDIEYLLPYAAQNIGSESESAERMRTHREKKKIEASHCDALVTECDNNVAQCDLTRVSISNSNSNSVSDSLSSNKTKNNTRAHEEIHKYGEYGWVKLTDKQYEKLLADLGEEELKRCITYVDEAAQSTSNKNKWKDWNLVIRRCHRDGWGLNRNNSTTTRDVRRENLEAWLKNSENDADVVESSGEFVDIEGFTI